MLKTESFKMTTEHLWSGAAVLTIHGEADILTTPYIEREIEWVISAHVNNLLINLSHATFLDCNFLSALIRKKRAVSKRGGKFALIFNNPQFHKIFYLTGLNAVFTLFETQEAAVNFLLETRELAVAV